MTTETPSREDLDEGAVQIRKGIPAGAGMIDVMLHRQGTSVVTRTEYAFADVRPALARDIGRRGLAHITISANPTITRWAILAFRNGETSVMGNHGTRY